MKVYTDYPIVEFGDIAGELAPVRRAEIIGYDGNKYAKVLVDGFETEIKLGYLYYKKGRCGEVKSVSHQDALLG